MPTILVTGANSLLATNIIIELLSRGYSVKGLLRSINKFKYNEHPNLELIQADFDSIDSIRAAMKHCDSVIHTAAVTRQDLLSYSEYERINVRATENLIQLSIREELKRFIFVSSANAFGFGTRENPGDENMEIKDPFLRSYYALSKLEGQQIVLSYKQQIDVVVVNPTFMIGAYDSKPSSGKIILKGYKKRFIFYPPGGKNFIHVQDAARGVVNALEIGKNGEAYLLANENLTYREFFEKLSAITHNHPVYIKLPRLLLLSIGLIGNFLRALGIRSAVSMSNILILCVNNFYSNKKAADELNLTYHSTEESIRDAVNWFIHMKMI